jgi:uncharacterized protein (DUF2252 family)
MRIVGPLPVPSLLTIADREAAGHAVRQSLPRGAHAEWSPPPGRRDPVTLLQEADSGRIAALLPERYARMAADPFGFLRGAAPIMAADLGALPNTGLTVQACGDCHLLNFGAYASPEGTPVFDINDFDETLPAPFEWDLKRLVTSLVVASLVRGGGPKPARALARRAAHAYRRHMRDLAMVAPLDAWASRIDLNVALEDIGDRSVRKRERRRLHDAVGASRDTYKHLVSRDGLRLPEQPPAMFRLPPQERTAHAAFANYADSLAEERRVLVEHYRLRDVAFKAVGIGGRGTFCAIGLFATADGDTLLLQLKEAQRSVLAPYAGESSYANHGQRVVTGQRMLQAATDVFLGWAQDGPEGRHFYVRQLRDQRLGHVGSAVEDADLWFCAKLCGRTLARAHARSGDAARIAGYMGDNDAFEEALAAFALAYSEQTRADHTAFLAAIKDGRINDGRIEVAT